MQTPVGKSLAVIGVPRFHVQSGVKAKFEDGNTCIPHFLKRWEHEEFSPCRHPWNWRMFNLPPLLGVYTLPKLNGSPQKESCGFQPSIFRCKLLVSGRDQGGYIFACSNLKHPELNKNTNLFWEGVGYCCTTPPPPPNINNQQPTINKQQPPPPPPPPTTTTTTTSFFSCHFCWRNKFCWQKKKATHISTPKSCASMICKRGSWRMSGANFLDGWLDWFQAWLRDWFSLR